MGYLGLCEGAILAEERLSVCVKKTVCRSGVVAVSTDLNGVPLDAINPFSKRRLR